MITDETTLRKIDRLMAVQVCGEIEPDMLDKYRYRFYSSKKDSSGGNWELHRLFPHKDGDIFEFVGWKPKPFTSNFYHATRAMHLLLSERHPDQDVWMDLSYYPPLQQWDATLVDDALLEVIENPYDPVKDPALAVCLLCLAIVEEYDPLKA